MKYAVGLSDGSTYDEEESVWIDADSPQQAAEIFRRDNGEHETTVYVQRIEPADYIARIADALVDWLENATADDEQLCDPDWYGTWEEPGMRITPDNRAAFLDAMDKAIRAFAAVNPDFVDVRMKPVGDRIPFPGGKT